MKPLRAFFGSPISRATDTLRGHARSSRWVLLVLGGFILGPFIFATWLALVRFAMRLAGIDIFPALP